MENKAKKSRRGLVISDKMDKTVVVRIDRVATHRLYKKKFTLSQNYKAHDEKNEYKVGDLVEIVETAPISRDKKFKVSCLVKANKTLEGKVE
ncbi:MAG: 30S ribosomal protein S17 [Candidatus Berkelbacteria bacterium]|nr:30S ribosomal protein S17 [Candidatus Berkelbacteria bacterium]